MPTASWQERRLRWARAPAGRRCSASRLLWKSGGLTSLLGLALALCTRAPLAFSGPPAASRAPPQLAADVLAANAAAHADEVRQSEELFFGQREALASARAARPVPTAWRSYGFPAAGSAAISDATPPPPFGDGDLARISAAPLLAPGECAAMIREADSDFFGWRRAPGRYGTDASRIGSMFPVEQLQWTFNFVNEQLPARLFPAIVQAFPDAFPGDVAVRSSNLRLVGARLVKYDAAAGQVELGYHRDGPLVTANIALNSLEEFEGGGTLIEALLPLESKRASEGVAESSMPSSPPALRLEVGHVLLHPGNVLHAGAPLKSGKRYVLVCFIMDALTIEHDRLCAQRAQARFEEAMSMEDPGRRHQLLQQAVACIRDALACGARLDTIAGQSKDMMKALKAIGLAS